MKGSKLAGAIVAALLASSAPSHAQYGAPFGSGILTTPELTNGAIGAGAANSSNNATLCANTGVGRDGARSLCPQNTPQPDPRPHR